LVGTAGDSSIAEGLIKLSTVDNTRTLLSWQFLSYDTVAIATDGANVYWARSSTSNGLNDEIVATPTGGGTTIVVAGALANPVAIAVDGTNLYWLNAGAAVDAGELMSCSLPTCLPRAIRTQLPIDEKLVRDVVTADPTQVFWNDLVGVHAAGSDLSIADYAIDDHITLITYDSGSVYWATAGGIFRRPR
jgi:hypothetical protein